MLRLNFVRLKHNLYVRRHRFDGLTKQGIRAYDATTDTLYPFIRIPFADNCLPDK